MPFVSVIVMSYSGKWLGLHMAMSQVIPVVVPIADGDGNALATAQVTLITEDVPKDPDLCTEN